MCRLLCVRSANPFSIEHYLQSFAEVARNSKEYQGHGWGCAWLKSGEWQLHHDINPVWEDDLSEFGETGLLIAHARSAFRDEGICVENNMPFFDGENVFVFNGELRGVRIKEEGRIGAEKIFNYIKRFDKGDKLEALRRGVDVIDKRTRYVRAMNIFMADARDIYMASRFSEDPDYFQMRVAREGDTTIVCSQPLSGISLWETVPEGTVEKI